MTSTFAWLNPDSDGTWSDSTLPAVDALLRALLPGRPGAVLVGTHEDRRPVIQAALDQLSGERPVYHLHGSTFARDLPYGSLSILLARLEISPGASWHRTAKFLGEFLSSEGSESAVVILSQSELMDRDSITVLAQLAQQRRVTLIVQCDRQLDLPPDFAALARAGSLAHVVVRPLTPAGSHALLSDHLGGPVSRVASTVLWRYSGGHTGQLLKVAEDCIQSGKLRSVEGCWVLGAGPMPAGQNSMAHDVVLRRLAAPRRALLEMLATCGPVQVSELVHAGHGGDLDALQGQGIVQIRFTTGARVAVVQPMWRNRVLAALEPERRRELDRLAKDDRHAGLRQRLNLIEEHLATADVAGALELTHVRQPAEPRADAGHDSSALGRASSVRSHLIWAHIRAAVASGDLSGAPEPVQGSADADDPCRTVLAATVAAARGDLPTARHWLDVTSTLHRPSLLDPQVPGRNHETVRLRAEATRAEVLAFSEDQDAARQVAAWVDDELSTFHRRGVLDDIMSTYDRASLAVSLLETHLRCGDLGTCRQLAEAILASRHGNPQAVLHAELVTAALELLSGQFERAHELAAQLAVQCEASGQGHARAVARALTAFCIAARDRDRPLRSRISESGDPAADSSAPLMWGQLGWFAELVRSLATDPRQTGDSAEARMTSLADRARAQGLVVVELHALLGAALLGSAEMAPRLQQAARSTQCAIATAGTELAEAILADDTAMFCHALTRLAAAGYTGWCHGGISPAVAALSPAEARRLAEAVAVHPESATDHAVDTTPPWMAGLTPREREIAQLVVDGLSNANVARRHGISVRTVEGHLYQIYAKLQVHGRCGLTRLAARTSHLQSVE